MSWTFGETLSAVHRSRLIASGASAESVDEVEVREILAPLPDWWFADGNALYAPVDAEVPSWLIERMTTWPCADTLIVTSSQLKNVVSLLVSGSGATIFVGPDCELTAGEIYCGSGSSVILDGGVTATRCAVVDARNGGSIIAERDQLWAGGVYIATDDMHRIEDAATGARINPFGAHIRLGGHVWLGRDATVMGHTEIGSGSIVGTRSLVRGQKVPSHTVVAGTPARVVREGITWSEEDLP